MKKVSCYDCDLLFAAYTSENVLQQMYTHYMSEHKDIIMNVTEEGKKKWMERFNSDWDNAEEM